MGRNMFNHVLMLILLILVLTFCACSEQEAGTDSMQDISTESAEEQAENQADITADESNTENEEEITMTMKINDETVNVKWENNDSVRALMKMAEESPVVVDMSMYGGFEQVGSLGTTLPSNDQNIKTKPGDIVLYTSDNIVVFYGNNSWAYTRLGHIENKSKAELQEMLSGNGVVITITAE